MSEIRKRIEDLAVGDRTNMGVTDDDLNIRFYYDNKEAALFFEGDILVQDDERYEVDHLGPLKQYIRELLDAEQG